MIAIGMPVRRLATIARSSLKVGLIPADGIGKEVIPVSHALYTLKAEVDQGIQAARAALLALGSDVPKPEFVDLSAGFEHFSRTGTALPDETIE